MVCQHLLEINTLKIQRIGMEFIKKYAQMNFLKNACTQYAFIPVRVILIGTLLLLYSL